MNEVYIFLKSCGMYFLATMEGDQPRVRPFGTVDMFEGRLCIQTGKVKDVSRQIHQNPKIEICAFHDGRWLRIAATAVEDDRLEAKRHMLDAYPALKDRYAAEDGNTEIFWLKDVVATFSSFVAPSRVLRF